MADWGWKAVLGAGLLVWSLLTCALVGCDAADGEEQAVAAEAEDTQEAEPDVSAEPADVAPVVPEPAAPQVMIPPDAILCELDLDCESMTVGECEQVACDGELGYCVMSQVQAGTACEDSNPCTTDSVCHNTGHCIGNPVVCESDDPCERAECDPSTGQCAFTPIPHCP